MFDLEKAIAHWRGQMGAAGIRAPATLDELENHLREAIVEQIQKGSNERQAFEFGILQMGESDVLKREFARSGETGEFLLRALVLMVCLFSFILGGLWVFNGFHSLRLLWFLRTHHVLFDPGDAAHLCRTNGVAIYGSIVGFLTIIAAWRLVRRQDSGFKLLSVCSWLTIIGVLVNTIWRIALNDFRANFIVGIILCLCLAYPACVLLLCKNPNVKNQYV